MNTARQHWKILRQVPDELANKVREFMVIGRGGEGVLLVTESGEGYWLGEMKFGKKSREATEPTRLDVPNLASMARGCKHILLLSENGQIYAMGKNSSGQLGLGTVDKETRFSPQLISIPHKFASIRCGLWHSVALTGDGKVWAWGGKYNGQVGMSSSTDSLPSSRQIPELDPHRVVAIDCGGWHSLALTDLGEVYAWGDNKEGQLGDGSTTSKHTPAQISTPSPVQSMAAGDNHTLLLTQTGEVYACGENESGQLGLPATTELSVSLVKVAGLPPISQIASHFFSDLSIAMSTDRKCFVWGYCDYDSYDTLDVDVLTSSIPFQLPSIFSTLDSVFSFYLGQHSTSCSVRVEDLGSPRRNYPETLTELLEGFIRVGDRIGQMFDNSDSNPDVKFELENQSILAHRNVLQISSAYFNRFFSESSSLHDLNTLISNSKSNSKPLLHTAIPFELDPPISSHPLSPLTTIPIADHCYPTFHAYLHFLYTGTLQVPTEHLVDLFELAHSHLESYLEQFCLVRMRSTLSPENCCLFYQLTERHSLPEFQQDLLHFIADNLLQVFTTEAYQSMDADLCKKLGISIGNLRR